MKIIDDLFYDMGNSEKHFINIPCRNLRHILMRNALYHEVILGNPYCIAMVPQSQFRP